MLKRKALLALVCGLVLGNPAVGQSSLKIELYDVDSMSVDVGQVVPHRIEFEESTINASGESVLDSYTYVTAEHGTSWGERHLMINWTAMTWNGTGFDINLASEPNLALRARITPRGAPFGQLVESHYYPGMHNRTSVNPDGEVRRYDTESGATTVYNEILWPYVLSQMKLREQARFILPGYNPYATDPFFFVQFDVSSRVVVRDDEGNELHGWRVVGTKASTVEQAQAIDSTSRSHHTVYLVSPDAPYFLGKESYGGTTSIEGVQSLQKRWRLNAFRILDLTPLRRMSEVEAVREERGAEQSIPWRQ